jgi:hypothetical protein
LLKAYSALLPTDQHDFLKSEPERSLVMGQSQAGGAGSFDDK